MAKSKYVYKGRSKIVTQIPQIETGNKTLIDKCTFIIIASNPMANTKMLGCPLINDTYDDDVLNLFLDGINKICNDPHIVIVGGYQIKKVLKHQRRGEYVVVENLLYDVTNSAQDLKIGLNASRNSPVVVLDSNFLPSYTSMSLLLENQLESSILYSKRKTDKVGCDISSTGYVNYFGYKCENKIKGAYYLSKSDADRMRRKITGSTFNSNKFDFEILTEIRIKAKEDNSSSSRLDENYEN
jgi:hypothetical protein